MHRFANCGAEAVHINKVVRKTMCILSSCLRVVGFDGETFGSLCGAFPFLRESTDQVLHLDESNLSSCNEPVLSLEECITALWFKPGSTHLVGLHVRLLKGASVQWDFQGWSARCGASGQCSLSVGCPRDRGQHPCGPDRLEESHCSECRWLCREAMVALCEVKFPGSMVTCFLWAVPSVSKILNCGVALSCQLSLNPPWDLLGDQ